VLFTIRNAFVDNELPALYEIERECFAPTFRWTEPLFRQEMLAARKLNLVWIASIGNRIAGFLIAAQEGSKISVETCNVARLHRRKGVASRLMAACEKTVKLRGYKEMKLEVYTENPAQVLYFQLGYRVSGFKRNYYGMKLHGISMAKKL